MQSTGHTSTHDLSLVPMHGSVMMYDIARGGVDLGGESLLPTKGGGARSIGPSAPPVRTPGQYVARRPLIARRMNSRITAPTNATTMLQRFKPVAPVCPNALNTHPPMNAPMMPMMMSPMMP